MSSIGTTLEMTPCCRDGHLVARLKLALHRDEDLDHLHHARRQVVAAGDLLDLVLEAGFSALLDLVLLVRASTSGRSPPPQRGHHWPGVSSSGVTVAGLKPLGPTAFLP